MTLPLLPNRDNLIHRSSEPWRPPVFRHPSKRRFDWMAALRRFPDLQAASIWRDLKLLLKSCQGAVLDVGCGAQPYRSLLPAGVHYVGIDTTDAQSHFGYSMPDTIYFEGATWPIASESIDAVIATETLEHVHRPESFLSEAKRVLKPDGWLVLTVPFSARWHFIPHDYWRFTPSGLRTILTDAGFSVPVVYARGNEVTVASYKVMAVLLMLLLGQWDFPLTKWIARMTGVFLLPMLFGLAILGQLSLCSRGGNDCLGYTAIASKPALKPQEV